MKQTSGALSLLLSAYRSVFSAAYTKGIAAAVVLTAGLSAGAANAALSTEFATSATAELPDVVQTGTDTKVLQAGENLYANSLTVNGNLTLDMQAAGTGVYIRGDTVISGAEHSLTLSDATWSDDEDVVKAFYGGIYNAGEDGAAPESAFRSSSPPGHRCRPATRRPPPAPRNRDAAKLRTPPESTG